MKKLTQPEVLEREAKLRREQLKEILAKQAELGVEVAELPQEYLCDSEKQDRKGLNGKEKQKRHDKRGCKKGDSFSRRQQLGSGGSSDIAASSKPEPTLLHKLLSADIRGDKRRLLQVFRFMVSNSFFEDWPDSPLIYPLVQVGDDDLELLDKKSTPRGVSAVVPENMVESSLHKGKNHDLGHYDEEEDYIDVDSTSDGDDKHAAVCGINVVAAGNIEDAEEGEIIDC